MQIFRVCFTLREVRVRNQVRLQNVNMVASSAVYRADRLKFKAKKYVLTKKSVFF